MRDDLYGVLGLEPRATSDQLERAYRFCLELYAEGSLATYSLLDPSEAEAQRHRVKEAYEILADPEKRRAYDETNGFQAPSPASVVPFPSPASRPGAGESAPEISGPALRRAREARGLSLRHISNVTKIGMRFLEYIEEDRHAFLPAPVYLRGFLSEYARLVGLEPRRVVEIYMARMKPKS